MKRHKSTPDGETVEFALGSGRLRKHRIVVPPFLNA